MTILLLIHVLAAIVAVGSNLTCAIWFRAAGTDQDRVVNPAYIVLLVTGLLMVAGGVVSLTAGWLLVAIGLDVATAVIGIALFAPAIRRQLVEAERDVNSVSYRSAAQRSTVLGIVTLMVTKPF
jgi:uncharacterized membrane protein